MHAPNFTTRGFQNHQPYINCLLSMTSSGCVLVCSSFYSFADTFLFLQHVKLITDAYIRMLWGEAGISAHTGKKYVVLTPAFCDDCSR